MASALREAFTTLTELDAVVVFIDEVEEIAGSRSGVPSDPAHGATNELLKLIPVFRQRDERLLICATNSVHSLDSAFLRPGRFDYVIPVGPPDAAARRRFGPDTLAARPIPSTLTRSSKPPRCSPRPISSSPPARAHSWGSSARSSSAAASRPTRRTT
ncbi:ATPase associated with various cellular activities family protein [Mycobacterium xenopi 3993]|nr:ATPase associated with various cellular activities family protein [Mycobacterium xenopi 3993]